MDEEQQQEKKTRRRLVDMFPDVEVGPREKAPEGLIDSARAATLGGFKLTQIQNWHRQGLTPRYIVGRVSPEGAKSGRSGLYHPDDVRAMINRPARPNRAAQMGTVEQRVERMYREIDIEQGSGPRPRSASPGNPVTALTPIMWSGGRKNLSGQFSGVTGEAASTTEDFRLPSGEINPDLL